MRIAYIISTYKLPALLVRLVRRLDDPSTSFFIHVDAKTAEHEYRAMSEPLADLPNVTFLDRHKCYWGDFGHVRATLKGLRAIIESGQPFDQVVLLTGQDYPLMRNHEIAARLAAANGAIYMDALPMPNPNWNDGGMDRIEHWHFRIRGQLLSFPGTPFRRSVLNTVWSLPAHALRLRRRFPSGFQPFGGGSYWCMPADCARHVDEFVRHQPRFVEFFQRVHVPDEIFFQTIVMNSPFRERVAGEHLRLQDWTNGGDNPAILTSRDLDRLVRSNDLFARKFDPQVDAAVLDELDRIIDRKG